MNREEQLHRYFEHVMSPAEEQSFLITVAASDEMRIAFRSQLELMKAVRSDKDSLRSVAQVRGRTLTALGLSATAVTPFIEHELLRSSKEHAGQMPQNGAILGDSAPLQSGLLGKISSLIRQPILALTGGLVLGVITTTAVMHEVAPTGNVPTVSQAAHHISTPPSNSPINGHSPETIPPVNGLNNSSHAMPVASRHAGENNRAVGQSSLRSKESSKIPETTVSVPATIQSHKAIITKDSAK